MPTYDYQCDACGATWEKFQSITAKPIKKCPQCGANRARRLIGTGGGIIFKGSGFYATDYRSDSYKNAAKNDSGADKDAGETKASDNKADAKTDKPDTKKKSDD